MFRIPKLPLHKVSDSDAKSPCHGVYYSATKHRLEATDGKALVVYPIPTARNGDVSCRIPWKQGKPAKPVYEYALMGNQIEPKEDKILVRSGLSAGAELPALPLYSQEALSDGMDDFIEPKEDDLLVAFDLRLLLKIAQAMKTNTVTLRLREEEIQNARNPKRWLSSSDKNHYSGAMAVEPLVLGEDAPLDEEEDDRGRRNMRGAFMPITVT